MVFRKVHGNGVSTCATRDRAAELFVTLHEVIGVFAFGVGTDAAFGRFASGTSR